MYRYFQPADLSLPNELEPNLKKHRIGGTIEIFSNEKDLAEKISNLPKAVNTIGMIGLDRHFETLVGLIKLIPEEIAIGYIPLQPSRLSQKLGFKNHSEATAVLAQRKINELSVFSVGSRFFFDQIILEIGDVSTQFPLNIQIDQKLLLRSPRATIQIDNISTEQFHGKHPLQLQLFVNETSTSTKPLFTELKRRIQPSHQPPNRKIAQVHGNQFALEAASTFLDPFERSYGSRVRVGQHTKNLRLITRRGTQI